MSFDLFGFDIIPADRTYGFWLFQIQNWRISECWCLLGIHYWEGSLRIDFLFARFNFFGRIM